MRDHGRSAGYETRPQTPVERIAVPRIEDRFQSCSRQGEQHEDDPGKAYELLPMVEQYAQALEGVIDRLLEHARVEEDGLVLEISLDEVRQIRVACAEPLSAELATAEEPEGTGPLVLVADDDRSCRLLIAAVLRQNGYRVVEAEDGRQALQIIEERRPDILVVDGFMPEVDGLEVCRRSKELDPAYAPRTVIVTAVLKALRYQHQALTEIGVDEYLTKPVRVDDLLFRLSRLHEPAGL